MEDLREVWKNLAKESPALEKVTEEPVSKGEKFDYGKPRVDLLPPRALLAVGSVLGFGAEKYGKDNWKEVENLDSRYNAAGLRHQLQHMAGERLDRESNLPTLAHAICCLMFRLEIELAEIEKKKNL